MLMELLHDELLHLFGCNPNVVGSTREVVPPDQWTVLKMFHVGPNRKVVIVD